jgi:DNA processing protein
MNVILKEDTCFPIGVKELKDCPDIIFVKGNIELLNKFSIAIVGSRDCTDYGIDTAKYFSTELSKRDIVIVSGLARGIDTAAHKACIEAGGKTIAVLAGGLDNIYPKENIKLANEIINSGGAIITEYFPDVPPLNILFPKRNRIVSAVSQGVLVIEAREKSGALIAANFSKKLGRKIFCVPSNISNNFSIGSNKLISNGAKCTICIEDILNEYKEMKFRHVYKKQTNERNIIQNVPNEYLEIYKTLLSGPIHINDICRTLNKNISEVNLALTMLELQGFVKQLPNKMFKAII